MLHALVSLCLVLSPLALAQTEEVPPKRYDSIVQGPDGSIIISNPVFNNLNGPRPISSASSAYGVCKLFGMMDDRNNSDQSYNGRILRAEEENTAYSVVISENGTLKQYVPNNRQISQIACFSKDTSKPYTNPEAESIVVNDDGSSTIMNPKYLGRQIGNDSSLDGVCWIFGFQKSVLGYAVPKAQNAEAKTSVVTIDDEGALSRLQSLSDDVVEMLVCRGNVAN